MHLLSYLCQRTSLECREMEVKLYCNESLIMEFREIALNLFSSSTFVPVSNSSI